MKRTDSQILKRMNEYTEWIKSKHKPHKAHILDTEYDTSNDTITIKYQVQYLDMERVNVVGDQEFKTVLAFDKRKTRLMQGGYKR